MHIFDLIETGVSSSELLPMVVGFVAALVSGYLVIRWLLGFLRSRSTAVFSIYCVAAGALCLIVLMARGG